MNEELIKKVVAILDEKWGNEDWKKLTKEEKLRIVGEHIDESGLLNGNVQ